MSAAREGLVYVGMWATPTYPHTPLSAPRWCFFSPLLADLASKRLPKIGFNPKEI